MAVAADLPSLENREEFKRARNSELVDVHGEPLGILTQPGQPDPRPLRRRSRRR